MAFNPAEASSLVLDVSTKPLIGLVWVGTVLVVIGTLIALLLRGRDLDAIPTQP